MQKNKPSAKPKQYNQVFRDAYSKELPCITKSSKSVNFAFCSICRCDFSISHGGISDIKLHAKSKKHNDYVKSQETNSNINSFFSKANNTLDNEVINAECLFTSFIVEHNLPIATADHAGPLLRKMFPNSEIAKKYGCARTKTTAIIEQMASTSKDSMVEILKTVPFTIATDGSNDSDYQLYPIVVAFYDSASRRIENSLLAVPALSGDSTGRNIGKLLLDNLEARSIPVYNCIALSADNAPVMIGLKNGVGLAAVLKEAHENAVVIGCPSAEKGAASLPIAVDEILVDIFYYLKKSGKRKEKLKQFQALHDVETRKILKHVCTRWLSLGRCLKQLLEQWAPLISFFKEQVKDASVKGDKSTTLDSYRIPTLKITKPCVPTEHKSHSSVSAHKNSDNKRKLAIDSSELPVPSKKTKEGTDSKLTPSQKKTLQTTSKSKADTTEASTHPNKCVSRPAPCPKLPTACLTREERLFMFLTSDVNKAYCLFLDFIIPTFERTNIILQSQTPQIHNLRSLLLSLLKDLLVKFVKPSLIKNCPLLEVKYQNEINQKNNEEIIIGNAATTAVEALTTAAKSAFFFAIRKYFIITCDYIVHKFPLKSEVLKHAQVAEIAGFENQSFKNVIYFVDLFPVMLLQKEGETREEAIDNLQSQFCALQVEDLPQHVIKEPRIDTKWSLLGDIKRVDGLMKYDRLARVMLSILTLPHGNAECERAFSQVKKTRTQFRSSMSNHSLETLLITKSRQKGSCYEQNIFLKKAKSATAASLKKATLDTTVPTTSNQ